MTWCGNKISR